jgi:SAM-dependent methyltransferase
VLDWGGDSGINTPFKGGKDNEIHIYDISGNEVNQKFRKVSIETAEHFKYDLIVCSNVLEHIPYPSQMLSEIKRMMSDGSILYIEVPLENHVKEFSSTRLLLEKKRHWHEHINFFSENALRILVFNLGFEIISFEIKIFNQNNKLYNIFMLACRFQKETVW